MKLPINEVTRPRSIARWASGTLAMAAAALLVSCSTTGLAKKQEALVCPQCRMVKVTNVSNQPGGRHPVSPHMRWGSGGNYAGTTYEHRCEGCQGALITFFREGKFQHKCSICKETPFTCPVIHPDTARLWKEPSASRSLKELAMPPEWYKAAEAKAKKHGPKFVHVFKGKDRDKLAWKAEAPDATRTVLGIGK